jgi:hypothetical protein
MIKIFTLILSCIISFSLVAQTTHSLTSVTHLSPLEISSNTAEKPQSKIWKYACTYWTVLPDLTGTHIWRLDGTSWTKVLTISTRTIGKADCKVVDNVTHILLFRGGETASNLVSVEYDTYNNSYKLWSKRTSSPAIQELRGTATIDIDSKGRMWLASNGINTLNVRWSDSPYTEWSAPITIASGLMTDDIGAIIALPNKIGVFWTDQNTRRFGFRTHTDGDDPKKWSSNEKPASQSALNINAGMADDHINMALAKDGTLYCAVKTGYNKKGYPQIALLVRRPSGTWDNLYGISEIGTRPIVILNEEIGKLKVIYSSIEGGGDILYNESPVPDISFSPTRTLISGKYDDPTSCKDNYDSETVVLVSNDTHATGVILTTDIKPAECPRDRNNLFIVYPNPFSEKSTLYFTLINGGAYVVTLYDTKGAKIAVLGRGTASAMEQNTLPIDGNLLSKGLYLIRLQAPGVNKSLKVVHED